MTSHRRILLSLSLSGLVASCASSGTATNTSTATATATASAAPQPKPIVAPTTPPAPADVNPFVGVRFYADPEFKRMVESVAAGTPAEAERLRKVATFPTAVWLESTATAKLAASTMDDALKQEADGKGPVLPVFVVYNLPNRDCAAEASAGELKVDEGGEARYQRDFIDVIAAAFQARPKQRVVVILEPDSLANMVTNLEIPRCAAAEGIYKRGMSYAIARLSLPNVFVYIDAAHSGWLSWPKNLPRSVEIYKEVLAAAGGPDRIRGFALNVSNYNPARDPKAKRHSAAEASPDEVAYAGDLNAALAKAGITGKGFIIDTARSGKAWIRTAPGNWCNVKGAGLGDRPKAAPAPLVDAYYWVKTPGESDGTADPAAPRFDVNCNSDDAAPGAPQAGELFAPYLIELAKNANPPL